MASIFFLLPGGLEILESLQAFKEAPEFLAFLRTLADITLIMEEGILEEATCLWTIPVPFLRGHLLTGSPVLVPVTPALPCSGRGHAVANPGTVTKVVSVLITWTKNSLPWLSACSERPGPTITKHFLFRELTSFSLVIQDHHRR